MMKKCTQPTNQHRELASTIAGLYPICPRPGMGTVEKLPWIGLAGTVLPLALLGLAYGLSPANPSPAAERELTQWLYIAIGVVVLNWTLVLTAAMGCVIVMLMKGPAFVADGFEVQHTDSPGSPTSDPVHAKN
jgi:hypothetical protein